MLIERRRSALTERCRQISDRYTATGDPVCPTVRRPGAAQVATGLEPLATYLEFLMAAILSLPHAVVERVVEREAAKFQCNHRYGCHSAGCLCRSCHRC